jgi:RNA recognition motif-containing protein
MNHKRIYVGDLAHSVTEDILKELLSEVGEVESIALKPGQSEHVQGFALVEMTTPEAARDAVRRFNGYDLDGRRLIVYTVPPKSRPRSYPNA